MTEQGQDRGADAGKDRTKKKPELGVDDLQPADDESATVKGGYLKRTQQN